MTNEQPLVTVGVPTRNRAGLLREALPTILGQDYTPLEILISDNCSQDETEELCRSLAARDPRVRYVRHTTDLGLYGNHNFCLNESRGEYVCLWHDDDAHDRSLIRRYVAFMREHPEVGLVGSDCTLIDDAGQVIGARDRSAGPVMPGLKYIRRTFSSGQSSVLCPGAMIRRSALGDARFEENGPLGFADFVLWFRIAERAQIGHIGERLWSYRLHKESLSRRKIWKIVDDYEYHLGQYCESHLARWPEHREEVTRWRQLLDKFLFWALAYEVGLHVKTRQPGSGSTRYRTVFDIADYRLAPEELREVLQLMQRYRRGVVQRGVLAGTSTMVRLRITRPLGWAADHVDLVRRVVGLR